MVCFICCSCLIRKKKELPVLNFKYVFIFDKSIVAVIIPVYKSFHRRRGSEDDTPVPKGSDNALNYYECNY